jgi:hypothetical protein
MNPQADLSSGPFKDFEVKVSKIQYGWMDITIFNDGNNYSYSASYTTDPLNDLLNAAVSLIHHEAISTKYRNEYFYIAHDLEGDDLTWLFIPQENSWFFSVFIDAKVTGQLFDAEALAEINPIKEQLILSTKDSLVPFIKAIVNTFPTLETLYRFDDEDWGYKYSEKSLKKLQNWLLTNDV